MITKQEKTTVTAAIPVTRFGGKVLAHSANSIAVSKALFMIMIESNLIQTRKNSIDHVEWYQHCDRFSRIIKQL